MRRQPAKIAVAVTLLGMAFLLTLVFRPFEGGPRYKGLAVSYWNRAITEWRRGARASADGIPGARPSRFQQFFGLVDSAGKPAVLSGATAALPVLLQLLKDEDEVVSNEVSLALVAQTLDAETCKALAGLLRDRNPRVRMLARSLLLQSGATAAPALAELLRTGHTDASEQILNILLETGPDARPALPELLTMLKGNKPLPYYAALVLQRIGPNARAAVPGLVLMLQDEDPTYRTVAADALKDIDPDAAGRAGVR
jgi:HEAT repeat protein